MKNNGENVMMLKTGGKEKVTEVNSNIHNQREFPKISNVGKNILPMDNFNNIETGEDADNIHNDNDNNINNHATDTTKKIGSINVLKNTHKYSNCHTLKLPSKNSLNLNNEKLTQEKELEFSLNKIYQQFNIKNKVEIPKIKRQYKFIGGKTENFGAFDSGNNDKLLRENSGSLSHLKKNLPFNFKFNFGAGEKNKEQFRLKSSDKAIENRYSKPNTNQNGSTFLSSANTNFTNSNKMQNITNNITSNITSTIDDYYKVSLLSNSNQNNNILIPILPLRRPNSNFNFGGDKILNNQEENRINLLLKKNTAEIGKKIDSKKKMALNNFSSKSSIDSSNKPAKNELPSTPFGSGMSRILYNPQNNDFPIKLKENDEFSKYKLNLQTYKSSDKSNGNNINQSNSLATRNKSLAKSQIKTGVNGISIDDFQSHLKNKFLPEDKILSKLHKIKIEKGMASSIIGFKINK